MENNAPTQRPSKFQSSYSLTKASFAVLGSEKKLLYPPLLGFGGLIFLTGLAAVANYLIVTHLGVSYFQSGKAFGNTDRSVVATLVQLVGVLFEFFLFALAANISAVTVSIVALDRFKGGNITVMEAFHQALSKISSIAKFSAISSTIGLILNALQERLPFLGSLVALLGGLIWNVATIFAVPVLATEPSSISGIAVIKKSTNIVKSKWGENLIVRAGIGLIAVLGLMVLITAATILFFAVALLDLKSLAIPLIIGLVVAVFAFILVFASLGSIATSALYYYATTGESPLTFEKRILQAALTPKRARRIFGA